MLPPWGVLPPGGHGGDPPGTATAVGGTHPTGMHSCWLCGDIFLGLLHNGLQVRVLFLTNKFVTEFNELMWNIY